MAEEITTYERIDRIRQCAFDIFYYEQLTPSQNTNLERERQYIHNPDLISAVLNMISDQGLLFMTTHQDLIERWQELVTRYEQCRVADWLLQASISWQLTAFDTQSDYDQWISRLAESYASPIGENFTEQNNSRQKEPIEASIAIDDERAERMAQIKEYRLLLQANPWLAYLATLQLSMPKIWTLLFNSDSYQSQYANIQS